jgi:hypothetical protein
VAQKVFTPQQLQEQSKVQVADVNAKKLELSKWDLTDDEWRVAATQLAFLEDMAVKRAREGSLTPEEVERVKKAQWDFANAKATHERRQAEKKKAASAAEPGIGAGLPPVHTGG